jgi:hypothetical protein
VLFNNQEDANKAIEIKNFKFNGKTIQVKKFNGTSKNQNS